jgi:hypothetical protein
VEKNSGDASGMTALNPLEKIKQYSPAQTFERLPIF